MKEEKQEKIIYEELEKCEKNEPEKKKNSSISKKLIVGVTIIVIASFSLYYLYSLKYVHKIPETIKIQKGKGIDNEEFNFAFIFNEKTNYYPFDKLDVLLKEAEKEVGKKINCHYIEINEIDKKIKEIEKLDMITCEPKDIKYLPKMLNKYKNVKWIHSMFSGVDKFIKLKEIGENDEITLTNARGAYSDPLAEYTILSMLYFNYNIPNYINSMANRDWKKITNIMVDKKTICIIGYGKNGVAIAKRVKPAFNMNVIGIINRMRSNVEGKEYLSELYEFTQINKEIISKCDFVLNTMPETEKSRGYFNKKFFSMMKKDAIFINIGRGSAVIEDDIIDALNNNKIRGAVLDVAQHEPLPKNDKLYDVPKEKLLITNHCGDYTTAYIDQSYKPLIDNIKSYIKDKKLVTVVKKKYGY